MADNCESRSNGTETVVTMTEVSSMKRGGTEATRGGKIGQNTAVSESQRRQLLASAPAFARMIVQRNGYTG